MTTLSAPTASTQVPGRPTHRRKVAVTCSIAALAAVTLVVATLVALRAADDSRRQYLGRFGWPVRGQAAYAVGTGPARVSPDERPVPIASVAKVMTALLVLRARPLVPGDDGFRLTVTPADVADTAVRRARDESVVAVGAGEVLSERQALLAVLLPSANNVAVMLARRVSGSVRAFVARMNAVADALGMTRTRYTDPSGYADTTVSTAADQLVLARAAMRDRALAELVATASAVLPVAGTVHTTDALLGTRGFVGIKTGSHDAAGGCFMFRVQRVVDGRPVVLTGVVLGQRGHSLLAAGLYAAGQLADRVLRGR